MKSDQFVILKPAKQYKDNGKTKLKAWATPQNTETFLNPGVCTRNHGPATKHRIHVNYI